MACAGFRTLPRHRICHRRCTARSCTIRARTAGGELATIRWRDEVGIQHLTPVFLPPAPVVQRGDVVAIELAANSDPLREPLSSDAVVVTRSATGLTKLRNDLRAGVERRLAQHVPGSAGALALGLLTGDDSALSQSRRSDLRASGLSHITAVSGWNVTIVSATLAAVLAFAGFRGRVAIGPQLAGLAIYVWIVGYDPPVVRAALMAIAVFAARLLGRPSHSITILALTAAVMACMSPDILGSVSFQLTIAATAGLIVAGAATDGLEGWRHLVFLPALTAVVAGVATGPILAASFGTFSLATLPANVAADPLVPIATFAAAAAVACSGIPILNIATGTFAWATCAPILKIAELFAGIPGLHWTFEPLSTAALAALSTLLLLLAGLLTPEGRLIRRRAGAGPTPRQLSFSSHPARGRWSSSSEFFWRIERFCVPRRRKSHLTAPAFGPYATRPASTRPHRLEA